MGRLVFVQKRYISLNGENLYNQKLCCWVLNMEKLFNVIRKLLLTFNWLFFGTVVASLVIHANSLNGSAENTSPGPAWVETIISTMSIFSNDPTFNLIVFFAACVFVLGCIFHTIIQWIFG